LLSVNSIVTDTEIEKPPASASAVIDGSEIHIPLEGLIDIGKEKERIRKEIENTLGFLKSVEKKLSNRQFVENAPDSVVDKEHKKKHDADTKLEKLKAQLEEFEES
jgi:valyl-tRNA synthetase